MQANHHYSFIPKRFRKASVNSIIHGETKKARTTQSLRRIWSVRRVRIAHISGIMATKLAISVKANNPVIKVGYAVLTIAPLIISTSKRPLVNCAKATNAKNATLIPIFKVVLMTFPAIIFPFEEGSMRK